MPTFIQPTIDLPVHQQDDPKIGHLILRGQPHRIDTRVVLIGFPSDEGVRRNWGRPGASKAPDYIRQQLFRLTPPATETIHFPFMELLVHTNDLGNIQMEGDMETDQDHLGKLVAEYLDKDIIPIILGGGHETAYGHFLGYVHANRDCEILNLDAHADVRPFKNGRAHSGSPFRQALEHDSGRCKKYTVAGLQEYSFSHEHRLYVESKGGACIMKSHLTIEHIARLYDDLEDPAMVTFDMDALDQSVAPGVSAPAVNGMNLDLWLFAAEQAGKNPVVRSMDLVEFNPEYDRDAHTARAAALTIWHFLLGLAMRGSDS